MQTASLEGGFQDPAPQSARAFRAVMEAMARPGTAWSLEGGQAPGAVSVAGASVLLTLCDLDTPLYLAPSHDTPELRAWIAFHTGAPIAKAASAMFAFGTWESLQPPDAFPIGTSEYPDRSSTLIVERAHRTDGAPVRLTGPGIDGTVEAHLPAPDLMARNAMLYPLGLDFLFTCGDQVMGLPRSTQIEAL